MLQRCGLVINATAPPYGLYPGGPWRGVRALPQAGRTDIGKDMSSGLYLYCTDQCAVCIHSHSVRSLFEINISVVLHCCGSLCECRLLRISQSQKHLTRYEVKRFKSHDTATLFLHALPKNIVVPLISCNVGIHFLEHCGKHFTYLNQSQLIKIAISSNLTVTAAHSI